MTNAILRCLALAVVLMAIASPAMPGINGPVRIDTGLVEGVPGRDPRIKVFQGILYVAPPMGDLHWRPPQQQPRQAAAPSAPASPSGRMNPPKPDLEFMARFEVTLDAPVLEVGKVAGVGNRRIIPITGGKFEGPRLKGQILNNGADWQVVQDDGVARLDTRYALKTDDGALIYIQTRGFRYGPDDVMADMARGSTVDPEKYYFRVYIQFETGDARYAWLNRAMAVGAAMRLRNSVIYDAYLIK